MATKSFDKSVQDETRTNFRRKTFTEIRHSLRTLVATALCEIRLQMRTAALWIIVIICGAAMGIQCYFLATRPFISREPGSIAASAFPFVENFVLLLLPFLMFNLFERDRRRKVYGIIWSRPVVTIDYALGKGLAALLMSLGLLLLTTLCGWLVLSATWRTLSTPVPWLAFFPLYAASNAVVILLTLFCVIALPVSLLGVLVSEAIVVYFTLFRMTSLLFLPNLTAINIFYSPSVGFGLDSGLLLGQALCFLLVALLLLGLGLLVYQLRERNGITYRRHLVSAALLVVVALGLLVPVVNSFRQLAGSYENLGPQPTQPLDASTSRYSLTVKADPNSGHLEGVASFLLTPGSHNLKEAYIALNAGLQVQEVRNGGNVLPFQTSLGWTRIALDSTLFTQGQAVQLSIAYAGQLTMNRSYYAQAAAGIIEPVANMSGLRNVYTGYLGQGVGYLEGRGGIWYPLPWTKQALTTDGTRPIIDHIQLSFPQSLQVYDALPAAKHSTDGGWQVLTADPHARLPMACVAALSAPQQAGSGSEAVIYHGEVPDPHKMRFYQAMVRQAGTLDNWLGILTPKISQWHAIVMPLLSEAVIGPGLLFIPEQLNNWEGEAAFGGTDTAVFFQASENIANAWWSNAILLPVDMSVSHTQGDPQQKQDQIILLPGGALNYTMFADYSAAFSTDLIVGHGFLQQEQSLCHYHGDDWTDQQMHQVDALGLKQLYCSFSLLDHLEQHDGANKVTQLLRQFELKYGQEPGDNAQFVKEASAVLGRDITNEAKQYKF